MMPCPDELRNAANALNRGGKIVVFAGNGCRGSRDELLSVSQRLNALIVRTLRATDIVEYEHPNWFGGLGMLGSPQGVMALDACDTLLMLGTDFPYSMFLPSKATIIQIDKKPAHIGRRCDVDIGIIGDVRATLKGLISLLDENETSTFLGDLQLRRKKWDRSMDKKAPAVGKKRIPPQAVTRMISDLADDDAIFVVDVGEITAFAARHLRMHGTQRFLGSFNHGSLNMALPGAMGVQALDKGRQVIALAEDGAFGMMMQDFVTAVRYELMLVYIVYNNHKLGFVALEMQAAGSPKYGTRLVNPRFSENADVCGAAGIKITDPRHLKEALTTALAAKRPRIVDIEVNPDELIPPPKLDAAHAWGYSLAKLKEIFVEEEAQ